ncbi:MAG: 16S rRNA (cytidine(1402)-2'-O)-methyltransferase, partial [Paludibacteraceae bacterium]|nr:16S rRNA (cytidine(1402)-2'-O)-methyltransferase [Paludibacteraceae bacterium]
FFFEGFLPQKKGRQTRMQILATLPQTFVFYESPFRLVKTLEQVAQVCGKDRQASVTREISKIHEETRRGSLEELIAHFKKNAPKGEIVVCVAGTESIKQKENDDE